MENLDTKTQIELQKIANDIKEKHDTLKQVLIDDTYRMEEIENRINENALLLEELEKNYINVIEKLVK